MPDRRRRIFRMAVINCRLDMDVLGKTPVAFDDAIGGVQSVDQHRHTGPAGNYDDGSRSFGPGG
jgi:hypothetical protein